MKRVAIAGIVLVLALMFVACGGDAALSGDEEITMANIDEYLDADARFVDLRNFSDQLNGGYIAGFELVPFFEYLEGRALVRNTGWDFTAADVVSASTLENIFGDKEGAIVLMCGSGTRAGYTKAALEEIGYTKVINAGGIRDYSGANKILGDGEFNGAKALAAAPARSTWTSGMSPTSTPAATSTGLSLCRSSNTSRATTSWSVTETGSLRLTRSSAPLGLRTSLATSLARCS